MLALVAAGALLPASPALAGKAVDRAFPATPAAGVLGGEFNAPNDIAFNDPAIADGNAAANGDFYVVDSGNNRIQRFNADETFDRAWGRDVVEPGGVGDTGTGFEVCTIATECKAGVAGTLGGEMSTPQGVAINQATGDLYVRDRGNRRMQQFTANGAFVRAWGGDVDAVAPSTAFEKCESAANCQAGVASGAAGHFQTSTSDATGVAVSPLNGNIFAVDPGASLASANSNRRLQEFEPDGDFVRAWGWGVEPPNPPTDFEICTLASGCQAGALVGGDTNPGRFGRGGAAPLHLAIDSRGIVYAHDATGQVGNANRILRFDSTVVGDGPAAEAALPLPPLQITTNGGPLLPVVGTAMEVDLDSDGVGGADVDRLYVARGSEIQELDLSTSTPTAVDVHMQSSGLIARGLAVDPVPDDAPASPGEHELYVSAVTSGPVAHRVYVLDDDGAGTPTATVRPALDVTAHSATLAGTVNPEGFPATYRFEYSKNGIEWTPVTADQPLPVVATDVEVDDPVTGLEANTFYKVRLVVTKGFGAGTGFSGEQILITNAAPPDVTTLPPNHRGVTTATLAGRVNPNGGATSYFFEYGTGTDYGSRVPAQGASAGSGGVPVDLSQQIAGLRADTTYHYRLVAENDEGAVAGDDVSFRTRGGDGPQSEGRAYELVSPADKASGVGAGSHLPEDLAAAASGWPSVHGERYAVEAFAGPTLLDGAFAFASDWAMAQRTPQGWISHSPFTHPNTAYAAIRFASVYAASDDFSLSVWSSIGGRLSFFPEQADWDSNVVAPALTDWNGRWEVLGPTDPAQGTGDVVVATAADGSRAVMSSSVTSPVKGLAGPGDPNLDHVSGRTTYVDDVSAGLSDSFPGTGVREPVGTCTSGTVVPLRLADGKLAEQPCAPPQPGRTAALISGLGASITTRNDSHTRANVVSRDGSRIFFMSPDPQGGPPACAGTDAGTSCPAQVYVRQLGRDGRVLTRWISRTTVPGQDAALLGPAYFEGASEDGDKVFFRTTSPLTADDPNGACGAPCTAGAASGDSWDLYMYDLPDGPDGDPSTPDGDPAGGALTRLSSGPGGTADPNVMPNTSPTNLLLAALRFVSKDGSRAYFASAAPIPGAGAPPSGTITSPGGTTATADAANLYLYDSRRPHGERWEFVARIPRDTGDSIAGCASAAAGLGDSLNTTNSRKGRTVSSFNCVRGSDDGTFLTFMTDGRLVAGDPDASSGDVYAYDSVAQELTRLSAPQGGSGKSYPCVTHTGGGVLLAAPVSCFGDGGIGLERPSTRPRLGMVTAPRDPADRTAFFQSKSQLVAEDVDDRYDVYQWRNGELSLLSVGTSQGAYYNGNSPDGQDVFLMTKDALSWQDRDAVFDVYDARLGGGIPQPPPPPTPCSVLADGCQVATAPPIARPNTTGAPGGGNVSPRRATLSIGGVSRRAARRAVRTGVLALRVRTNGPTLVEAVAKAKLAGRRRTVARTRLRVAKAGAATVRLRLSRPARRQLKRRRALSLSLTVDAPGVRAQRARLTLRVERSGR